MGQQHGSEFEEETEQDLNMIRLAEVYIYNNSDVETTNNSLVSIYYNFKHIQPNVTTCSIITD